MLNEPKILNIFRLKTSKLELCIKNSQYLAFASKFLWLHFKVTPSIGIENNHRKNCKQCLISRTAQQERIDRAEETDNFFLGCIVGSFGIAITLALVLLPLSICCTALIYHPIFVVGVVLFIVLTVFGAILCIFHPFIAKWWWYKDETTGICSTAEPGPSPTNIYW